MPWSQQGSAEEHETNIRVLQQEGQANATSSKAAAHYNQNVDYKPEGSDPDIKAIDEGEENSDAVYAKMELL